ncbi:hypothetical protein [Litorivivens sp.]|uniref:hypothetical protein n=1 Tax=Litorivivens sp. TaxID=2020868 RepID=UPI00356B25B9
MAIDQLSIYNNALRITGERKLASLTEDRPPRHYLDDAWDFGAVDFCLELIKPRFATKIVSSTSTTETQGFSATHSLPSDYVAMVALYSDSDLSEPVTRFLEQGGELLADHSTVYLRYVSRDPATSFTNWTPSFARAVAAFLAKEVGPRIRPDATDTFEAAFQQHVDVSRGIDSAEEPRPRSKPDDSTLSLDWLNIYNDALFCLDLPQLTSVNDDSEARTKLSVALSQNLVEAYLFDKAWQWAVTSSKITYDPSVEPEWGYQYAFDKPDNILKIDGVFVDEYFQVPLIPYEDEGDLFFANVQEIYLKYIPLDTVSTPASWPAYFRKLVAASMAVHAGGSLGGNVQKAVMILEDRESKAFSIDAQQSPPRIIANGNWTQSRWANRSGNRGRP